MAGDPAKVTTNVHDPAAKSTDDILDHHLQAFGAGDLSGILEAVYQSLFGHGVALQEALFGRQQG